ncbi:MAG: chemotaxis protein [Stappia sp.]|uniref:protein phosphatase CheZ n=1 Tax=Stappia sp. TaxID=1870903 RepID=UPI000C498ED7|nr:protein phosphatase CheZ [Stappia sp.]MAA96849.1 chemotaxis protein [Stappia sp.]MBM21157.1 chemotaxis protein [Stappia sp.]
MGALTKDDVAGLISFLEQNREKDVTLNDVIHLAEMMTGSMREFLSAIQPTITSELMAIADEIGRLKVEIQQLRPHDMKANQIPEAGRELDAIVEATESATVTIMEAAETIMGADDMSESDYRALVNDKMIEVFEACSFQDITGQRISKVVGTLNAIDRRVSGFVERLRIAETDESPEEETEEERRKRELILHGPQHEGEGVSQADIDSMMAGESQADIDKLFD